MTDDDFKGVSEIAGFFKERDNKEIFNICIANVIKINPLVLKVSSKIFLGREYDNLSISETLKNKITSNVIGNTTIQGTNYNVTSKADIKIGDNIIVVPTADGERWYAIDRVVI